MTDRNPNVILGTNEERCVPSGVCKHARMCARAVATIPASGAKIIDGWAENMQARGLTSGAIDYCRRYHSIKLRERGYAASAPAAQPAKKWIGA